MTLLLLFSTRVVAKGIGMRAGLCNNKGPIATFYGAPQMCKFSINRIINSRMGVRMGIVALPLLNSRRQALSSGSGADAGNGNKGLGDNGKPQEQGKSAIPNNDDGNETPPKVPIVFSSEAKRSATSIKFNKMFIFVMKNIVEKNFLLLIAGAGFVAVGVLYFLIYETDLLTNVTYMYPSEVDRNWYKGYLALKNGDRITALECFHLAIEECQKKKGQSMATYILMQKRGQVLEKAGFIDDAKAAYLGLVDFAKGTSKPIYVIFANDALRRLAELETDIGKKERYYRHMLKLVMANESRTLPDYDYLSVGVKQFVLKRSEELLTDNILLYGNFLMEQKMYEEVLFLVKEGLVIAKKNDRRLPRVSSMYDMAGWACWNLGKLEEAMEWGKKALVHANRFFNLKEDQFLYHMGLYLEKAGNVNESKSYWERAKELTVDPSLKVELSNRLSAA